MGCEQVFAGDSVEGTEVKQATFSLSQRRWLREVSIAPEMERHLVPSTSPLERKIRLLSGIGKGIKRIIAFQFAGEGAVAGVLDPRQTSCKRTGEENAQIGGETPALAPGVSCVGEVSGRTRALVLQRQLSPAHESVASPLEPERLDYLLSEAWFAPFQVAVVDVLRGSELLFWQVLWP